MWYLPRGHTEFFYFTHFGNVRPYIFTYPIEILSGDHKIDMFFALTSVQIDVLKPPLITLSWILRLLEDRGLYSNFAQICHNWEIIFNLWKYWHLGHFYRVVHENLNTFFLFLRSPLELESSNWDLFSKIDLKGNKQNKILNF